MRTLAELKEVVEGWRELDRQAESIEGLIALAVEEEDDSLLETLADDTARVAERLRALESKLVLIGEYDKRNAIVSIHAGPVEWSPRTGCRC